MTNHQSRAIPASLIRIIVFNLNLMRAKKWKYVNIIIIEPLIFGSLLPDNAGISTVPLMEINDILSFLSRSVRKQWGNRIVWLCATPLHLTKLKSITFGCKSNRWLRCADRGRLFYLSASRGKVETSCDFHNRLMQSPDHSQAESLMSRFVAQPSLHRLQSIKFVWYFNCFFVDWKTVFSEFIYFRPATEFAPIGHKKCPFNLSLWQICGRRSSFSDDYECRWRELKLNGNFHIAARKPQPEREYGTRDFSDGVTVGPASGACVSRVRQSIPLGHAPNRNNNMKRSRQQCIHLKRQSSSFGDWG